MGEKVYPPQNPIALGDYYVRHVSAMTSEGLHDKADIAEQLAWRDKEIDRLRTENRLRARAVERWVPCPDHRDKTDDQGCYVCRIEKLTAQHERIVAGLEADARRYRAIRNGYIPDVRQMIERNLNKSASELDAAIDAFLAQTAEER